MLAKSKIDRSLPAGRLRVDVEGLLCWQLRQSLHDDAW